MAPSQLKRLKTSLRDQGIVGPQKSKKQKRQTSKSSLAKEKRVHHNAALQSIREQFNPFEVKVSARGNKYEFANSNSNPRAAKGAVGRPGITKGLGEETVGSRFIQVMTAAYETCCREGKPYLWRCSAVKRLVASKTGGLVKMILQ